MNAATIYLENVTKMKNYFQRIFICLLQMEYLIKSKMYLGAHGFQHKRFSKLI